MNILYPINQQGPKKKKKLNGQETILLENELRDNRKQKMFKDRNHVKQRKRAHSHLLQEAKLFVHILHLFQVQPT